MNEKVILTQKGYDELEKTLEELKLVKRPEITERIKTAREFGDLSENAEYDAAKNEQARIEGEILLIEEKLKNAQIINGNGSGDEVITGSKVSVVFPDDNKTGKFIIVGITEAGVHEDGYYKISNESPIGKALLKAKEGETVIAHAPKGELKIKVVSID